jgi:hypothetical protein
MKKYILVLFLVQFSTGALASEAILIGEIDELHYRLGYLLIQVKSGGVNSCAQCGPDISGYSSSGFCWVDSEDKTLASMVLTAFSANKSVKGRVMSWSECKLYQFNVLN